MLHRLLHIMAIFQRAQIDRQYPGPFAKAGTRKTRRMFTCKTVVERPAHVPGSLSSSTFIIAIGPVLERADADTKSASLFLSIRCLRVTVGLTIPEK